MTQAQNPKHDDDAEQRSDEPEWVKTMHAHFVATGEYRAVDLQRVLGDPRKGIGIKLTDDLGLAGSAKK